MVLYILRGVFILLVAAVAALYILPFQRNANLDFSAVLLLLIGTVGLVSLVIAADAFTKHKRLSALSGIFLGLLAGLVAAFALSLVVDLVGLITAPDLPFERPQTAEQYNRLTEAQQALLQSRDSYLSFLEGVKVLIGLVTCYLGISLVLQTKDDFRFVIPYVEFAKQIRGARPIILDTSVIIDGRILDIIDTRVIQGTIVIPRFVLNELQTIADSADKLKRSRGRRGLDILQKIQASTIVDVMLDESEVDGVGVDQKLISLAEDNRGRVMTNDYNLNKVATLRGVEVINLNDLAKALRPVVLPGEEMIVKIVKPGENPTQGVGYLDDGTMVVVEEGRSHIGESVDVVVTSTLQTSAGRMIFGKFDHTMSPGDSDDHDEESSPTQADHSESPQASESQAESRHTEAQDSNPPQQRPKATAGTTGKAKPRSGRNPRRG